MAHNSGLRRWANEPGFTDLLVGFGGAFLVGLLAIWYLGRDNDRLNTPAMLALAGATLTLGFFVTRALAGRRQNRH